jgi:capsular polysaccharide biosynthesis protein
MPSLNSWQRESLELAGVNAEMYREIDISKPLSIPRLMIPSPSWIYQRDVFGIPTGYLGFNNLSNILTSSSLPEAKLVCPNRIYVSRLNSKQRSLSNEKQVQEIFVKHGFTPIVFEELSYREGAFIFANADVIAGPSGAALARLLFCKPNTSLISLSIRGGWHMGWNIPATLTKAKNHFIYLEDERNIDFGNFGANAQFLPKANQIKSWKIDSERLASVMDIIGHTL